MSERNYSFLYHCLLSCISVMFQKEFFSQQNRAGHKQPLGWGTAPWFPRSDGNDIFITDIK